MFSVLVIDDSAVVRESILDTLKEYALFECYYEAEDGLAGFKSLLEHRPDLVLCDLEMPRMDGFKFLSMMGMRDELKDTPVILLTGMEDREHKIKGLEQGAVDYVTKPFDAGELVARVKVQLKIKGLQNELRRSNELLKELSITDHLTKLYNRRYLMEALDREYQRTFRKKAPLSLIMLDIDYFKKINDTYGHQGGDEVLVLLAELIKGELRSFDIAARYGGEEFAIVLPETPLADALAVAERLRRHVQEFTYSGALRELTLTVSLGVASFPGERVHCIDSLIHQADHALYRAKGGGRNRVEIMSGSTGEVQVACGA